MATRAGPPRALRRVAVWGTLGALGALGLVGIVLDRRVAEGFRGERWRYPVRIYGASRVLRPGSDVEKIELVAELERQGYREVHEPALAPGTFRRGAGFLDLALRGSSDSAPGAPTVPRRIRLALEGSLVREITAVETHQSLTEIALDPPLLEGSLAEHWVQRRPLRLEQVPRRVIDAVLLAEDARFFEHPGVDLGGLMRALRLNWQAGALQQGGSTITQQLVKNLYLTPERTLRRKLVELPMALLLERHASKEEILEAYLATVYLGHDRLVGIHGLAEAAAVYFGKSVSELTLGEGAMLGGMIRAPNTYSPLRHPERALARRDQVIRHLLRVGRITPEEAALALAEPAPRPQPRPAAPESFVLQQVRRELGALMDLGALPPGSAIFTTLDPWLQRIALEELRASDLDPAGPEIALVALDPRSGAIRALLGSRDYLTSQLDRATRARRALGAMVQPLLALARTADRSVLPDSQRIDVPEPDAAEYALLVDTLALSPPSRDRGAPAAEFSGSLLDLVSAYSIFPAGGRRPVPSAVTSVQAPAGEPLLERPRHVSWRVDPEAAFAVHTLLARADEGASRRSDPLGSNGVARVGMAALSHGRRDAWKVGYSPSLVLGIWSGFDDRRPLDPRAADRVAVLWSRIFERVHAGLPGESFAALEPIRAPSPAPGLLARGASR